MYPPIILDRSKDVIGKSYHLSPHCNIVIMKGKRTIKRSEMKVEDIGLKFIDDRSWILRQACHGDPSRAFWIGGRPLPLCSRCVTFYPFIFFGILAGMLLFSLIQLPAWQVLIGFALLEAPLVFDGWTQYVGLRASNNGLRAITGALAGTGIGAGIVYMVFWTIL